MLLETVVSDQGNEHFISRETWGGVQITCKRASSWSFTQFERWGADHVSRKIKRHSHFVQFMILHIITEYNHNSQPWQPKTLILASCMDK